ncbi:unnamed protein product [Parajaminaea phylloscopi]
MERPPQTCPPCLVRVFRTTTRVVRLSGKVSRSNLARRDAHLRYCRLTRHEGGGTSRQQGESRRLLRPLNGLMRARLGFARKDALRCFVWKGQGMPPIWEGTMDEPRSSAPFKRD